MLLACLVLGTLGQAVAPAAPGQSAEELKSQLDRLKSETKKAGAEWDKAYWRLDEVELKVEKTDKQIAQTKKELAAARAQLSGHAVAIYRRNTITPYEVLVGAATFQDLVTRIELMQRIGKADADAVAEVKRVQDKLTKQRSKLATEKRDAKKAVVSLKAERDRLQAKLKSKQADFAKVKAELDAVRGGANRPSGRPRFPVPTAWSFRWSVRTTTRTRGARRVVADAGRTRVPTSWLREAPRSWRSFPGRSPRSRAAWAERSSGSRATTAGASTTRISTAGRCARAT